MSDLKLDLPWLTDSEIPQYVRDAARKSGEEVLGIDTVPYDVRDAVSRLRAVLVLWSWKYYDGEPETTDDVYDAGYKYIKTREARFPELATPLSPTRTVGKVMDKRPAAQRKTGSEIARERRILEQKMRERAKALSW